MGMVNVNLNWLCVKLRLYSLIHRCNELGFFQDGAPDGTPTIATRLIQPSYDEV